MLNAKLEIHNLRSAATRFEMPKTNEIHMDISVKLRKREESILCLFEQWTMLLL